MDNRDSYPHHVNRTVTCLDGLWDFFWLGDQGPQVLPSALPAPEKMMVPWAFDASPDFAGKRGAALYSREICVPAHCPAQICFEAVSLWCSVWVDGQCLGTHGGGFTPFQVTVPPSPRERRTLQLMVDNRFDLTRNPLHDTFYDFYQWGGITRPVYLHVLPETHIRALNVVTTCLSPGEIEVEVVLSNELQGQTAFQISMDQGPLSPRNIHLEKGRGKCHLALPHGKPWSPENPELHQLRLVLGHSPQGDDYSVRFGLRTVAVSGRDILLNGHPVKLLGYNRHESHPQFGPSLPPAQMVADLEHLKALGCNFIRGCHYPQDQRFLDLCDEMGFLVWEESLGWQNTQSQLTSPQYRKEHLAMIEAMVGRSFNHPSVIMWGFLNEGPSDCEWARPAYEESAALLRRLDPSRPITFASHKPLTDLFYGLVDIISQNLYPGWYGDNQVEDRLSLIAPKLSQVLKQLDDTGFGDKPYILSEIGAEALYGWHDPLNNYYTEEFQAAYLNEVLRLTVTNPRHAGIALWHFADARTYTGAPAMTRPRCFNNKGTLDEYRRPKLAYQTVRRHFTGKP